MKPALFHSELAAILAVASYAAAALTEVGLMIRTWRAGLSGSARGAPLGLVLGPTLGIVLAVRAAEGVPSLALPGPAWRPLALGIVLIWGGLALRWWAVLELGRFFSVTVVVQAGHRVVETG